MAPATLRPRRSRPTTEPTAPPPRPRLLDMEGAIAALATTRPTFYRWLRSGAITGVKVGRQWRFRAEDIDRFLAGKGPRLDLPGDIKPLLATLERRLGSRAAAMSGDPVQRAVALMIGVAHALHATDVHLSGYAVDAASPPHGGLQMRIDGALEELCTFDIRLLPLLVGEWRRLADLHADAGLPELGWIRLVHDGTPLELRVTVLPSTSGACMTASFFRPRAAHSFDGYGLSERDQRLLEKTLTARQGLCFFTGPVGSGKSHSLYAAINRATSPTTKVMTVEDLPPFLLPRTVSVRVNEESGLDYPTALRACMNSDPDLIGIGEVRDRETLALTLECATTGHLVLVCMYTSTALACLRRLIHLCGADILSGDVIRLVTSQRLVRRLCSECAVPEAPPAALLRRARALAEVGGIAASELGTGWKTARGCERCRGTGYAGRTPVMEVLEVTREVELGLRGSADDATLTALAVRQGMTTLAAHAIRKAAAGETTLAEVQRCLPDLITLA